MNECPDFLIRRARVDDVRLILELIRDLALARKNDAIARRQVRPLESFCE